MRLVRNESFSQLICRSNLFVFFIRIEVMVIHSSQAA